MRIVSARLTMCSNRVTVSAREPSAHQSALLCFMARKLDKAATCRTCATPAGALASVALQPCAGIGFALEAGSPKLHE